MMYGKGRQVDILEFRLELSGCILSQEGRALGDEVKGVPFGESIAVKQV